MKDDWVEFWALIMITFGTLFWMALWGWFMKDDWVEFWALIMITFGTLFWMTLWGGLFYVAIHFITKFW